MLIRAYERQLSCVLIHISSHSTEQAVSTASVAVETLSKVSSSFASRILLKLDPSLISTKCHQFISHQTIFLENKHAGLIFYSSTHILLFMAFTPVLALHYTWLSYRLEVTLLFNSHPGKLKRRSQGSVSHCSQVRDADSHEQKAESGWRCRAEKMLPPSSPHSSSKPNQSQACGTRAQSLLMVLTQITDRRFGRCSSKSHYSCATGHSQP